MRFLNPWKKMQTFNSITIIKFHVLLIEINWEFPGIEFEIWQKVKMMEKKVTKYFVTPKTNAQI